MEGELAKILFEQPPYLNATVRSKLSPHPMYRAIVLFLAAAVIWIFGSLPWVVLTSLLCDRGFETACPDPEAVGSAVRQILALDLILIIMAAFCIAQLRQHPQFPRFFASESRRARRARRARRR